MQKGLKTAITQDRTVAVTAQAKRLCKAQSTVRYPKDHPDPALSGQPILDADGARRYKPCERPPMRGQEVCQKHGGLAPQAQQAAKMRLLAATEPLIAALVRIAQDERLSPDTRIKYINSALDRAGIRGGIDVAVDDPRWMQMLGNMFGRQDDSPDRTIDAEVVEPANVGLTSFNRAELDAVIGEALAPDPPKPDFRDRADFTPGDEAPPARWGLSKSKGKRVRR